jgi:hypothetical protein
MTEAGGLATAAWPAESTVGAGATHGTCREGRGVSRGSETLGCVRGSTARGVRQWGDRTPRRGRQPCGGALNERATRTGAPERPGAVSLESLQSTLV